jgi:hypothetical protein
MLVADSGLLVAGGQPLSLCGTPSRPNQLERRSCFFTAGISVVAVVELEKVT